MGSYARFEHYSATLEVETRPEFCPPTTVFWPTGRVARLALLCSQHGERDCQSPFAELFKTNERHLPFARQLHGPSPVPVGPRPAPSALVGGAICISPRQGSAAQRVRRLAVKTLL